MKEGDRHFPRDAKEKILRQIFDVLKGDDVEIISRSRRIIEFRFPIDRANKRLRIYENQIDLVQFFTVIHYVDLKNKNNAAVVTTIKEGYVDIARKTLRNHNVVDDHAPS